MQFNCEVEEVLKVKAEEDAERPNEWMSWSRMKENVPCPLRNEALHTHATDCDGWKVASELGTRLWDDAGGPPKVRNWIGGRVENSKDGVSGDSSYASTERAGRSHYEVT